MTIALAGGASGQGGPLGDRAQLSAAPVAAHQPVIVVLTGKGKKGTPAGPYQLRWSLTTGAAPPVVEDDPMPPEEE